MYNQQHMKLNFCWNVASRVSTCSVMCCHLYIKFDSSNISVFKGSDTDGSTSSDILAYVVPLH